MSFDPSPEKGYPTYRMLLKDGAIITVRFFSHNLCRVEERSAAGGVAFSLSAVDYIKKEGNCDICIFRLPFGSIIDFSPADREWKLIPQESDFNGILDVPHVMGGGYPSSKSN